MIHGYPNHTLVYWKNEQSGQLEIAVLKFFQKPQNFNHLHADLLRDYLKHWTSFRGHYFPKEEDRQNLLKQLDKAQSIKDFSQIIEQLLKVGIDPF
ncbi:hypothetical protein VB715_18740 [Crocosphaera sp. UHCC 0190]|uniref:hypothetical protein n=1 Tax=Crocosphaera sp. UHCC 0190 TaxID=3110246 RepID=UPI002B200563|nr:hypothetical protein [Crocosphaera sp. UHCC 0190]MEA5511813.1 hypothetical protein [Crocosphaera sp. UHCC 0190]